MKTTIENALNNTFSLHLNACSGTVYATCYDEQGNKHEGECNDTISYDRYRELQDWCESEEEQQEFSDLYNYFVNLCE